MKMHWSEIPAPLVLIVGPTAVGKTDSAIRLARKVGAEIISADSRYFYRGMDIGTAKPSLEERGEIPHHLIDVANPDETWSLSVFKQEAVRIIKDVQDRGKLPLLVGGTGQYIHAILHDWQIPVQEPDVRLREVLEAWGRAEGPDELHRKLAIVDPEAAQVIEAPNLRRTVRALEVIFSTGRKFSTQRRQQSCPYSVLKIGLMRPRNELYARIDGRIEAMLENGFVDEVKGLLAKGYRRDLPAMSAIGYREVSAAIEGSMSLEEAITFIKRQTRVFVRRQANWFKESDPSIYWFYFNEEDETRITDLVMDGSTYLPPLK